MKLTNNRNTTFAVGSISFPPAAFIFLLAITCYLTLAIMVAKINWALEIRGTEIPRIAASVAGGGGFSSPFGQPTGPSAWVPPVYPYLLAGIFRVFGVFTFTSYWVAVAVNIIVHAFTCVVLYWVARETFGRRSGWCASIALAIFPLLFQPLVLLHVLGGNGVGLFIPPGKIWYTHLSELAIVLLIWLTLRQAHWAIYGTAWGIAALTNTTLLALMPAFLAWRLWHRERWRDLGLAVATAVLCTSPWLVRNYLVFHRPVFIRDDFGVELRAGNQPGQKGLWSASVHPSQSAYELSRVAEMGEAEYAQVAEEEAMDSIRSRPGEFAVNTIRRVGYFWVGNPMPSHNPLRFLKYLPSLAFSLLAFYGAGRALKRGNRKALLFVAVLFFYPLVHYITHVFGIGFVYQYPIQPVMLALATSVFIRDTFRDGRESSKFARFYPPRS